MVVLVSALVLSDKNRNTTNGTRTHRAATHRLAYLKISAVRRFARAAADVCRRSLVARHRKPKPLIRDPRLCRGTSRRWIQVTVSTIKSSTTAKADACPTWWKVKAVLTGLDHEGRTAVGSQQHDVGNFEHGERARDGQDHGQADDRFDAWRDEVSELLPSAGAIKLCSLVEVAGNRLDDPRNKTKFSPK